MIHPAGMIEANLSKEADTGCLRGTITLPAGVSGSIYFKDKIISVNEGFNAVDL
jgi:hypothetical protein